jgi:uncharacterized protein (DUF1778 family)
VTREDVNEMTEAPVAEDWYQSPADLTAGEVPSRPAARLDVMVSARFSRDEVDALRQAAGQAGMTLSAFLRQSALAACATNVVNIDRVRQDIARVRELAADALRRLA